MNLANVATKNVGDFFSCQLPNDGNFSLGEKVWWNRPRMLARTVKTEMKERKGNVLDPEGIFFGLAKWRRGDRKEIPYALKLCCDCRFQRVITACSWVFKFFYQLKTQQFEFSNFEITHLCVKLMRKTTVATSLYCSQCSTWQTKSSTDVVRPRYLWFYHNNYFLPKRVFSLTNPKFNTTLNLTN